MKEKTIVIAVGGTGGHLFPAQALAEQLGERRILFAGDGLKTNPYFDRKRFLFEDVPSLSPFAGRKELLKAPWVLGKGIKASFQLLSSNSAQLVIGFGSFHSFPLLVAAHFKRIPLVLFEPNARPGKVNRLFSKGAHFTAVLFEEAQRILKGNVKCVAPLVRSFENVDREKASEYFYLDAKKSTLLVFGGSQGAKKINAYMQASAPRLAAFRDEWQILHFTGIRDSHVEFLSFYQKLGLRACVKLFEEKMEMAWSLADLVICRSGASTIAEQLSFGVPALFIPYPHATDDHQAINALAQVERGGALCMREKEGGEGEFISLLEPILSKETKKLEQMRCALKAVKEKQNQQQLSNMILDVSVHGVLGIENENLEDI